MDDLATRLPDRPLPALFERQAHLSPDRPAVVCESDSVSYGELNSRSNRLAHWLIGQGVGPESVVAVSVPRSVGLVVAMLAVLKAGAAYLPVDPDYPAERVEFMLRDVRSAALLDEHALAGDYTAFPDTDPTDADRRSPLTLAHPAYVIYTSGSTGRPKGVVVPHRGVVSYFAFLRELAGLDADDTVLNLASASFSPSVRDIFGPLVAGARLVLVPPARAKDPAALLAAMVRHQVTVLPALVPTMLSALAEAAESPVPSLRLGLTVGEALTTAHTRRAGAISPSLRLVNQYGPTECTMVATFHAIEDDPADARHPIGLPVPGFCCYLLDERLRPVPPGVVAELYLGGDDLARGYVNGPGLTAERFVADPFGPPGARMYRTGDLARRRDDGVLEFAGRVDDQVKLRGNRVELGEVQVVLGSCPGVARAAVALREDQPGDQRLVGYLVAEPGAAVDLAALRGQLAERLPDYMVPSAFVTLATLPLTPNGKLDRKALPAPQAAAGTGRAPSTAAERALCALFAEVLGLPSVGVDDDFFALGGHSLLAVRLISRIRSAFGVEIPLATVFEARTVAGLLAAFDSAAGARVPLAALDRPELVPLSLAQRRLWFLHQFEGPSPTYNVAWAARIQGVLDRAAMVEAVGDVVARHESLRTVFAERDGDPHQLILGADRARPDVSIVDIDEAGLADAVRAAANHGFDLAVEAPLRVTVFALGEREHLLLLVMHHIAADGGSLAPLANDLSTAYAARSAGTAPDWPPLPVQYADFALWQRELLGSENGRGDRIAHQVEFWRRNLAGAPELLELPTDRPRPAEASFRGDRVPFALPPRSRLQLAELAKSTGTTTFMAVHAALAALLTRLGAGVDIPLGAVAAGRDDEALDGLVGFFVNTLVLRTDTSGDPTFRQLLARVRATNLAAYANQDVPFERLVEVLNPARSVAHTPLFQVVLTYENGAGAGLELPGASAEVYSVDAGATKYDLSFFVWESAAGGIEGYLDYATDLFDRASAEALTARFVRLLEAAVAEPDLPISRVEVLSAQERHELVVACNETDVPVPDALLPDLFEAQARRTPDATAVVFGDCALRYRELDARANKLARMLVQCGVGPERFVAVALPKSVDLVVALLAVLKAGAAYLAVDPAYPAERIGFMLDDMDPVLVLTSVGIAGRLPERGNLVLLDDPHTAAVLDPLPDRPLTDEERTSPLRPANPALVIYTSGSTGRPKGVVVEHYSLNQYLAWSRHVYPGVAGHALVHSSVSFDLTVTGIYAPLTAGGCVHLIELDEQAGPAKVPVPARPTFVKATPSHLPLLINLPARFSPTEQLVLGGEALLAEVLDEWRHKYPSVTVYNEYGPTETTVGCMECRIGPGEQLPPGVVTLGRPSWNTRMYVLDGALRPVPLGVAGELYIAGDLVTRGYHNRPGLTAGRYVANPFGPLGSRMYRSGDLGRRRADGRIEFVSRVDDQVKVRGFRIELGEIEAVLGQDPSVAHAAVIVREDQPGDKRLVAYVVLTEGAAADEAALRVRCAEYLPEYMVPSAFVTMDVLPLTPNRKLDRRSLPAPSHSGQAGGRSPRTAPEEVLCRLFAEVLGVPTVGIDDNFFALGGHSLIAVRLISRIRSTFGVELSLRALFESATVATVADQVGSAGKARPALRRMPRPEEVS